MFDEKFRSFESPVSVLPRKDKYVLTEEGQVRQIDTVYHDEEKIERLGIQPDGTNWVKDQNGNVYQTSLYVKFLALVFNKFASLDPFGLGVMMDAEKPGWNDAMNGLPALFGSGMSETIELYRVIQFLFSVSHHATEVTVPVELEAFFTELQAVVKEELDEFAYFNRVQDIREKYRSTIRFGVSGEEKSIAIAEITQLLESFKEKLLDGMKRALEIGEGIMPTFLTYKAEEYELTGNKHPQNGLPTVHVTKWSVNPLPHFLEAPARPLKLLKATDKAKELHTLVKGSPLFDTKLNMYLTSVPLDDESIEIGRIRAFTAGWLERESCFMHMEYKYLLGLLKSGLYDDFFNEIQNCLPPFMDPNVYGRSILENSSFIVSSRNPNANNHGRGFVARLTGTTSEMLSMWILMMTGPKLFRYENGELILQLKPIIHNDFFDENNEVRFRLLNQTEVVYKNPSRKHTFGDDAVRPVRFTLVTSDNEEFVIDDSSIKGKYAEMVRNGEITNILIDLN